MGMDQSNQPKHKLANPSQANVVQIKQICDRFQHSEHCLPWGHDLALTYQIPTARTLGHLAIYLKGEGTYRSYFSSQVVSLEHVKNISQCVLNGLGTVGLMVSAGALGRVPPFPGSYYGKYHILKSSYPAPQPMDRSTIPGSLFTQILIHTFSPSRTYQLPNVIHKQSSKDEPFQTCPLRD